MWAALKERLGYAFIGLCFGCMIGVLLWLLIEMGFSRYEAASGSPAPIITWVQIPAAIGAILGFVFKENAGSFMGGWLRSIYDREATPFWDYAKIAALIFLAIVAVSWLLGS